MNNSATNYREERNAIRQAAREAFATANPKLTGRELDRGQANAANEAEAQWAETKGTYDSIYVVEREGNFEIRDERFGGSIDIHKPHVDLERSESENPDERYRKVIKPGYIGASSWNAGQYCGYDCKKVQTEMLVRLRMMEMALLYLNRVNELVLDWKEIENPFEQTRFAKEQLERYQQKERDEIKKQNEKIAAREAKKKQA